MWLRGFKCDFGWLEKVREFDFGNLADQEMAPEPESKQEEESSRLNESSVNRKHFVCKFA